MVVVVVVYVSVEVVQRGGEFVCVRGSSDSPNYLKAVLDK